MMDAQILTVSLVLALQFDRLFFERRDQRMIDRVTESHRIADLTVDRLLPLRVHIMLQLKRELHDAFIPDGKA